MTSSGPTRDVVYRRALPEDIAACIELRGRTRENAISAERLKSVGITLDSWSRDVAEGTLPGHVASERRQDRRLLLRVQGHR